MITVCNSNQAMDNFRAVLESAYEDYYPSGLSNDLAAITLSKLEEHAQFNINEMIELACSLPQILNEDATNVTNPHIVQEKKGKGISVTINGKEYRYVSPDRSTEDLFHSFMGMYKHANAGYKALNYLKKNALCYYGAKNPKGKELVESFNQGKRMIQWNPAANSSNLDEKINDGKLNESVFKSNGTYLTSDAADFQRVCSILSAEGIPYYLHEAVSVTAEPPVFKAHAKRDYGLAETTQPSDIPPSTSDITQDINQELKDKLINEAKLIDNVPKYLYHATYAGNTDSILQKGIIPGTGSKLHGDKYDPRVYLATSKSAYEKFVFMNYGVNANGVPVSIFQVDTDKLSDLKFFDDPAFTKDGVYTSSPIPKSAIKLIEDGRPALSKLKSDFDKSHSDLKHEEKVLSDLVKFGAPDSIINQQKKIVSNLKKSSSLNESLDGRAVINTTKTGMSYYDDFLNPKDHDYKKLAKGLKGEIKMMSTDEYIDALGKDIFHCSRERVLRGVEWNNVKEYAAKMAAGTKFNIPILDLANETQEGRHRALAAAELGVKQIPILVVTKYDPYKELKMPKSFHLWYGHTLQYTKKDGTPMEVHVGLDEAAMKAKVSEIVKSRDYKK